MSDIYSAPQASLDTAGERFGGNIEEAVSGQIRVGAFDSLGEAWRRMKGFKWPCQLAFLIYFVLAIVVSLISIPVFIGLTSIGADASVMTIFSYLIQFVITIGLMPVFFGIHIMGIRHLAGRPVSTGIIFQYFSSAPRLFLSYMLMTFILFFGFLLLVIPGLYLMVAYMFAMPLIVEKDMPAWQAMEVSRKAITKNWFSMFGLLIMVSLINSLALLTLGIAWIWTIPWSILTMSLIHVRLFGAEADTLAD